MAVFFLSYRRDDSAGFAGRLADALEGAFGAEAVFRDVDDIPPAEDFSRVIEGQMAAAKAVLVMIGPRWLPAAADGRRRLEEADDFVRREIALALDSGKPVFPLLVGGAAMPGARDLPEAIVGLARLQAVVLSDADWRDDVAGLVARLRPIVGDHGKSGRGRRAALSAGAALLAAAVVAGLRWLPRGPGIEDLAGPWTARVKYDWGDEHDEVFEFKLRSGRLHGTASFLTGPLAIEDARLEDGWLSFVTRSQESMSGSEGWRETTHRYIGQVMADGIHFTLEQGGGLSVHRPVEFVARRAGAGG